MEITRETDYAMRCIDYLCGKKDEITMVDEIAKKMNVPRSFLAKILQKLARAELVKSFRGVKGGFQLARPPAKISLLDVVEAIEGEIAMNVCTLGQAPCGRSVTCPVHPAWVEIRREFRKALGKYNFEKLRKSKRV